jgi:hypothetical protein
MYKEVRNKTCLIFSLKSRALRGGSVQVRMPLFPPYKLLLFNKLRMKNRYGHAFFKELVKNG